MSWDNDSNFDHEYYDNRCFPEEFSSMDEYNASFGGHSGYVPSGRRSSGSSGLGALIFWIIFLYIGFHVLVLAAIAPPLGALGIMGLIWIKGQLGY